MTAEQLEEIKKNLTLAEAAQLVKELKQELGALTIGTVLATPDRTQDMDKAY